MREEQAEGAAALGGTAASRSVLAAPPEGPAAPCSGTPALSFIVAACNVEPYLTRCLDSLVGQTRGDIEVIVVDDGSTDGTAAVIAAYARRFPTLVRAVHREENGGPSAARRSGLALARSSWVAFVDGDDWVSERMAELFLQQAARGADFVYAPHVNALAGGRTSAPKFAVPQASVASVLQHGKHTYWGKLWSRELLQERAAFPAMFYEDVAEVPALVSWVSRPAVLAEPLYFYNRCNETSVTAAIRDARRSDLFKADQLCWQRLNPTHARAYKLMLAEHLLHNLRYADVHAEALAYAKWAYGHFGLHEVQDELPVRQRALLQEALACEGPVLPSHLEQREQQARHDAEAIAALREQRDHLKSDRDRLKKEREALKRQRDEARAEREALKRQRDELRGERTRLKQQQAALTRERDALRQELAAIKRSRGYRLLQRLRKLRAKRSA